MIIKQDIELSLECYISPLNNGNIAIPKTRKAQPCIYAFVYAKNTLLKIGYSTNLKNRMRDHSTLAPLARLLLVIYYPSKESAYSAEQALIKLLSTYSKPIAEGSEVFNYNDALVSHLVAFSASTDTKGVSREGKNY